MARKPDGERLTALEVESKNIIEKVNNIENSVQSLHGKFDSFSEMISKNYIAVATFDQYKQTVVEKEKNKNMDRLLWIIITAAITGLIAYFLRELKF